MHSRSTAKARLDRRQGMPRCSARHRAVPSGAEADGRGTRQPMRSMSPCIRHTSPITSCSVCSAETPPPHLPPTSPRLSHPACFHRCLTCQVPAKTSPLAPSPRRSRVSTSAGRMAAMGGRSAGGCPQAGLLPRDSQARTGASPSSGGTCMGWQGEGLSGTVYVRAAGCGQALCLAKRAVLLGCR